ncbi:unnamed protein product [Coregonus sp. 'balchen']|nr:unnamed protein product [Coregonus sp. 'balchen']
MENEIALISICTQTSTPSPPPAPVSQDPNNNTTPSHHAPRFGTIIPNRIFVGGIDFKTNENDLRRFFSQHGAVKEVKIVIDRTGVSKGYGFVTFETQEDTERILHDTVLPGQEAQHRPGPNSFSVSSHTPAMMPTPCGTMYLTTSTGYPYTYHNGVAYFHTPEMSPSAPYHWPQQFIDHMVQPAYNHTISYYPQSPGGMTPVMIQQEPGKEHKFHVMRRGYPSSPVSLKPRYGRNPHYAQLRKEYRPEITSDHSPPPTTEPVK